jgi:hypothetical protein
MPRFLLCSAGMRVSLKNGVPSSGTFIIATPIPQVATNF